MFYNNYFVHIFRKWTIIPASKKQGFVTTSSDGVLYNIDSNIIHVIE